MTVMEFFWLYVQAKLLIALFIGVPLCLLVIGFQWYLSNETAKAKERYRKKRELK